MQKKNNTLLTVLLTTIVILLIFLIILAIILLGKSNQGTQNYEPDINSKQKIIDDDDSDLELLEEPEFSSQPQTNNAEIIYRVRVSANNADSQLGAFKDLNNAKKLADENSGYKVYDQNGNLVYASVVTNNSPTVATDSNSLYRVRKSANDSTSQLGAFKDLNNAKKLANQNSGYKVYDQNGNLVYAP